MDSWFLDFHTAADMSLPSSHRRLLFFSPRRRHERRQRQRGLSHAAPEDDMELRERLADGLAARRSSRLSEWAEHVQVAAIQVVHQSVKSAQKQIFASSETMRIALNVAKVLNHLYSMLACK